MARLQVETQLQVITPKEATKIIEKSNIDNRKVRLHHVEWFSNLIKKGEWVLTHQGIAFDVNGRLVDGQHRILAIAKSGVDTPILVTRNLEPEAYNAIDTHSQRNMADVYKIHPKFAAFITTISKFKGGSCGSKFNNNETLNVIKKTSHFFETLIFGANVRYFTSGGAISALLFTYVNNYSSQEYIASLYRNLKLLNYIALPPIGHAFAKSLALTKDFQTKNTVLVPQLLYVFDPENESCTKIRSCSSEVMESFKKWISELIKD
jgi:hydrogenase maturation factor